MGEENLFGLFSEQLLTSESGPEPSVFLLLELIQECYQCVLRIN
jgi:hypothetical protein